MKANLLLLVIGLFFGTGAGFLLGQTVEGPKATTMPPMANRMTMTGRSRRMTIPP